MIELDRLRSALPVYGLGEPLYAYDSIGSTNERAAELAEAGAPHGTLVIADAQTAGRGRSGRTWVTPPGTAIALSLVLRLEGHLPEAGAGLAGLGALSVVESLAPLGLTASIKWPNDVLLEGKKVGGVLADVIWEGNRLAHVVLGIGVNIALPSLARAAEWDFPATCVETVLGRLAERTDLLIQIVAGVGRWLPALGTAQLIEAWERRLAYLGHQVRISMGGVVRVGRLAGLDAEGKLRLETSAGIERLAAGDLRLRPVDSDSD